MNFIKKIFTNKVDESVHNRFLRFGKGIYEKRAVCTVRAGSNVKINTTFEYANDFVEFFYTLSSKMHAKGKILIKEDFDLESIGVSGEKKHKRGFYEITVDQEISSDQINKIKDKAYFLLLALKFDGGELSIKQSLPRTVKGKKIDGKFCVAVLDSRFLPEVRDDFLFDAQEGKKISVEHTFEIKEILLPEKVDDYEKARAEAKRKGKITRKITVDGKEQVKYLDFVV